MKRLVNTPHYMYLEMAALMIGLPLLLYAVIPLSYMLPTLWVAALYCHFVYLQIADVPERIYWRWNLLDAKHLWPMLQRFAVATVLTVALTLWFRPDLFLGFVTRRPEWWAIFMILYPLVSVIPQEVIFRTFFFQRYAKLFPTSLAMVLASGILFGAAHVIFQNWVAPILCVIGGIIFADTYAKTRSLALVTIEHALYGCMIFTVGLGRYFYHGAIGPV